MKVIFISNSFDHHAKPLSDELSRLTGGEYMFLATEEMTDERIKLGWGNIVKPKYVYQVDFKDKENVKYWQETIKKADVVISGSAPEILIKERRKLKKLTFLYAERLFKRGIPWFRLPYMILKDIVFGRRPHDNCYMLSASAYNPYDFSLIRQFERKTFRWGYFTECKQYSLDELFARKEKYRIETRQDVSILWAARLIGWKHPEYPVMLAEQLHREGISFHMNIIGCGMLEENIKEQIEQKGLKENVKMLGSMTPQEVRSHMEDSDIFLFTSDRNEGWGAVLNESMNSGCAVVANQTIGSVPFLLQNGVNGLVYENDSFDDFYTKVKYLIAHPDKRKEMGIAAYHTIVNLWNAGVSACRLLTLADSLLQHKDTPFAEGPCSKAPILKDC